jgi:hypothetical protein
MAKPGPKPGTKRQAAKSTEASPPDAALVAEASTPAADAPVDAVDPAVLETPAEAAEPAVVDAKPEVVKAKPGPKPKAKPEPEAPASANDRENPDKLSGQALRDLAHQRGIALSTLCFMSDEKIRTQLRYITYRQYEDSDAVD